MGKSARRVRKPRDAERPAARLSIVTYLLIALIAVTPLGLLNGIFLSHDVMPKLLLILCGAALLLLSAARWLPLLPELWKQPDCRAFPLLLALQFVSLTVSTVISSYTGLSFAGTVWRRFGWVEQTAILVIALASAAFTAADRSWLKPLTRAISLCGALAALYACLQFLGIDPFLDSSLYRLEYLGGIVRPPATMGHAIYFGAWMAAVTVLAASAAASDPDPLWKRLHAIAAVVCFLATFISGSRGAALAVTCAGIFIVIRKNEGEYRRKFALAVAGVGLAAVLLTVSPVGTPMRNRLRQWTADPGGPRLAMWKETVGLVASHPVAGTGPETFGEEFRKVQSDALSRAYPDFFNETPHNVFLDAASAQGLPGLFILCGVFVLGLARRRGELAGFSAAIVALLIAGLFASFSLVSSLCLWCFAGIIVASKSESPASESPASESPTEAQLPPVWFSLAAVPAMVFLLAAALLSVADAKYTGLANAVKQGDAAKAEDIYRSASGWSIGIPLPGYELYASRQLALLARSFGNTPQAVKLWLVSAEASAAAERGGEERASAAYQSALLAVSNGNLGAAESESRKAIALAPSWYKPHLFLAQVLAAYGRTAEAAAEQQRGSLLAGVKGRGNPTPAPN